MNDATVSANDLRQPTPEEIMSAIFASMVIQQTNMAMMMLGKVPHPETGETFLDLESARMFIDQIEMLQVKTKGNLDKREENLLKQSLSALQLAFVEVLDAHDRGGVNAPAHQPPAPEPTRAVEQPHPAIPAMPSAPPTPTPVITPAPAEDESRKRYSKKY